MKLFKNIGPGTLVAAAFIGPGTVAVCTMAGVEYGFTLLWAMVVSIIATIVLQEMALRLGLVHGKGLAETVRLSIKNPTFRFLAIFLMLSAILIGNAAYEAGNVSGGVLGMEAFVSNTKVDLGYTTVNYISFVVGLIAFVLLYLGNYKTIERWLIFLVIAMSISFLITAILTQPDIVQVIKGLFIPDLPKDSLLTVIALVGTTVVPYNLFLYASIVSEKWKGAENLKTARTDLYVSVILGGLVSVAIIIAGASVQATEVSDVRDLAQSLEPLYGSFSTYFLSIGLFAAGITSAITAPLAAAYVVRGCFGWEGGIRSGKFRMVWIVVLLIGVIISSLDFKLIEIIQFAQVANGLLLPIISAFLIWVVNKRSILGDHQNKLFQNILGFLILLTTLALGARIILKALGVI